MRVRPGIGRPSLSSLMPPSLERSLMMDDEHRFENYRLSFLESLPDSEWKHALINAIKQKIKSLDSEPAVGEQMEASRRKSSPDAGSYRR